jgi:hypothetical protein
MYKFVIVCVRNRPCVLVVMANRVRLWSGTARGRTRRLVVFGLASKLQRNVQDDQRLLSLTCASGNTVNSSSRIT